MDKKEVFEYTYSAKQQEEVEALRKKYLPQEEDKMETLRRMDKEAERPGTVAAIVLGIIGTLIFGSGMSLAMLVMTPVAMAGGILLGVTGITLAAMALPVYRKMTKKERERIAPQVLALTEELLK